jgi:RsiW-degrading membrane proteinase PrsW (M82 family)
VEVLYYVLFAILIIGNGTLYYYRSKRENKKLYLKAILTLIGAFLWLAIGSLLMELFSAVNRELFIYLLNTLTDPVVIFVSYFIGTN